MKLLKYPLIAIFRLRWGYYHIHPSYIKFTISGDEFYFQNIKTGKINCDVVWVDNPESDDIKIEKQETKSGSVLISLLFRKMSKNISNKKISDWFSEKSKKLDYRPKLTDYTIQDFSKFKEQASEFANNRSWEVYDYKRSDGRFSMYKDCYTANIRNANTKKVICNRMLFGYKDENEHQEILNMFELHTGNT